jgi:secretion/DNA translocation related TadE-like protein
VRKGNDRGYALLWGLLLASALVLVGVAALSLCSLAVAHTRAGNAADLAAIAGATARTYPCLAASRVAAGNAAELLECASFEGDVIVRVGVRIPEVARWLGQDRLEVTARAGRA